MSVKLFKRSSVIKKILLFIILTYIYIFIIVSINVGKAAINIVSFMDFYVSNFYFVVIGFLAFYFVYSAKQISKWFFSIFCIATLYFGIDLFFQNFYKSILIFNFIFLVMSFYFYLFLKLELEESIYRPAFHKLDIGNIDFHNIKASISGKFGENITGHITNWDRTGCFIQVNEFNNSLRGAIGLKVNYKGNSFFQHGSIVTSFHNGVGIKFKDDRRKRKKTMHDWLDFYAIIQDMGLKPRKI